MRHSSAGQAIGCVISIPHPPLHFTFESECCSAMTKHGSWLGPTSIAHFAASTAVDLANESQMRSMFRWHASARLLELDTNGLLSEVGSATARLVDKQLISIISDWVLKESSQPFNSSLVQPSAHQRIHEVSGSDTGNNHAVVWCPLKALIPHKTAN